MAYEDISGLPGAYDRGPHRAATSRVIVREGNAFYAQGAELNEIQHLIAKRGQRISDRIMKDGDRAEGAEAFVDQAAKTVHCFAGAIYVQGDVLAVPDAWLTNVAMTGSVVIGVRLVRTVITELDDPSLLGIAPGTAGEGEPGAAREVYSLTWGFAGDGGHGELYAVYQLLEGTIITQAPPPALTGVQEQIGRYDYDANGHYIIDGCDVTALGRTATAQVFSISAGTANILGYKRIRETAMTVREIEDPDVEAITGEGHTFTGATGGSTVIAVNRAPVSAVQLVQVVKRVTESRVRGAVAGGSDALTFASATEIESIVQGGTTFAANTYVLASGSVSWAPAGAEPVPNSTYTVTYLYNAAVVPTLVTDTAITVTGGVQNKPVAISYTSKLPRVDLLCLDLTGRPVYVKGISARRNAMAPLPPTELLKLAEIRNDWFNRPAVDNNGTRNLTYDEQRRLRKFLITLGDQFDRSNAELDILSRSPVSKGGIFTDQFISDFFRDQGEAQTAAINQGVLQLAIDNVLMQRLGSLPTTLPFAEEIIVSQPQRTSSALINPYDNFTPMPAGMRLEPAVDFWTEEQTVWTSPVTREFTAAPDTPPGQTTINEVTQNNRDVARFLRSIALTIVLEGFGVGENLKTLTFDGINIKPAGTQTANASGVISLTITIPPNIPSGRRLVRATGMADSFAEAIYVGEGTIDVATMRRVTLVTRAAPIPVQITLIEQTINQTIVQNTNVVVNQLNNPITNWNENNGGGSDSDGSGSSGSYDPLAWSFRTPAPRFIIGVNFWITAVGSQANGLRVQLATMLNGYPTTEVLAEAFVSMATAQVGDKLQPRFRAPVFLSPTREYCFVILTSDGEHAVAISRLGDIDPVTQQRVSSQPYTIGEMFTSSNRQTWTPHPDADPAFEVVAARFTQTSLTVNLWTGPFDDISDLLVRGTIDIPTQEVRFRYELVRANGQIVELVSGQTHEFAEYVKETVTLRAVLEGTQTLSPVLYAGTLLAGGKIRQSGDYVSRVFPLGSAVAVSALFKALLPIGSAVAVSVDNTNDSWQPLTLGATGTLGDGWIEPKYERPAFTAVEGRVRLQLTGGPAARPSLAQLRAYTI